MGGRGRSGVRPREDEEANGEHEQDEQDDLDVVALRAGRAGRGAVHGEGEKCGRYSFGQSRQSQRMVSGKRDEPCLPEWPPSPNSNL